MEASFLRLLNEFWRDLHDPAALWEVGVLLACVALASWLQWRVRQRHGTTTACCMPARWGCGASSFRSPRWSW